MSKRSFEALIINCVLIGTIYASDLNAQHISSVKDVSIKMKIENADLMHVIQNIESRTNYEFSYKREDLDPNFRISGKFNNSTVADVLMEISKQTGLKFRQVNNNIHISKAERSVTNQDEIEVIIDGITITGRVTSYEDGEGLPGVNVVVKGTTVGTVTDVQGNFSLEVVDENAVLVFSSVGFSSEEILVGNKAVIDMVLMPDITSLSEIVVIGYGTQEKKDVTGAVESVKAEQIQRMPVAGFNEAMQGQVAGVYITQPTGQPGGATQVQIRGAGSINAGNAPLYVIDGMIVQNGASAGGTGSVDVFSSLNPNDIESIDILKDASAAAIYGARGANGVIIVTTKSGREGPAKISFDAYYGVQSAWKEVDMLNTQQYQTLMNEARDNSGDGRIPALDGTTLNTYTNWQDEVFTTAPIQNYNLSVQGGSANTKYFLSAGYFDQDGIIMNTGMKRGSMRFNMETKKGIFTFGNNVTLSRSLTAREGIGSPRSILLWAASSAPHIPVYDPTSVGGFAGPGAGDGEPTLNPVAAQTLVSNDVLRNRMMGNIYGQVEIIDGLNYRINLGGDIISSNMEFYAPDFELGGQQIPGFEDGRELTIQNSNDNSYIIENTLNYNKTFGKHRIGVLAGYTSQEAKTTINSTRVLAGNLNTVPTISGGVFNNISGGVYEWSMTSLLGRITYDYDGKYLFTGNIRRDGSSRFGENNKYGVFPSVSAGWRISEEAFLANSTTISNLKLRASYGVLGNDRIPNYAAQVDLNPNANIIMGSGQNIVGGVTLQSEMPNQDLKWEQVAQFDVGIDLGLFDNKLLFIVDYYEKKTTDMLLNASVPRATGFSTYRLNAGEVENKGWEFTATYRKSSGDFKFDVSANLTTLSNEVISLGPAGAIEGNGWSQQGNVTRTITEVGHPIGSFYGYLMDGIYQDDAEIANGPDQGFDALAPGDIRWKDIDSYDENGELTGQPDGIIDLADRTFLGSPLPELMYGLNLNASYKGFDLSMLFQGVSGNSVFSDTKFYLEGYARTNNLGVQTLNRWTPQNKSNVYPRPYPDVSTDNNRVSSRWIEDGSYLRLKNMQIGYNLPDGTLEALHLERARVYIGGQNLLTFTDYLGWEPEVGSNGFDQLTYPQARSIMIGLQLGF